MSVSAQIMNNEVITFIVQDPHYNGELFLELINFQILTEKIIIDKASIYKGQLIRHVLKKSFPIDFFNTILLNLTQLKRLLGNENEIVIRLKI